MATSATPYGLKPIGLIGGQSYAGSTRQIKIASAYGTNIYNGSIVSVVAAGTLEIVTTIGSAASPFPAGTVGVFVGCSYTDPSTSQQTFKQYWPTGTVATDAVGYVVDDPDVLFMMQADGAVPQSALGSNAPLAAAQSTSTGSTTIRVCARLRHPGHSASAAAADVPRRQAVARAAVLCNQPAQVQQLPVILLRL